MLGRVVERSDLGPHAMAWDDAVAAMELPSPFLRSWWLSAIADGSAVFLIVEDDGSTFLGGLPLTRRAFPLLEIYTFLGSRTPLCPDHLDVVVVPGHEQTVAAALRTWAGRKNRLFVLDGVAETSAIATWLPRARTSPLDVAPYQPLADTKTEYLAARPRPLRKTVRRARNRFATATVRAATAATLDAALARFAALHEARGDRRELLASLPALRQALAAGVACGEAWVDELVDRDETLAVLIAFACTNRVSLYQTARAADADNASTILNLAAIERGIDAGCTEVDLLRGDEPYKRHYAEHRRRLTRIVGASGPLARAALSAAEVSRAVRASRAAPAP